MDSEKDIKQPLVEKQSQESQKAQIKPASFFSLLRYSDRLDKIYMVVGSLAAMGAGAAMPFFMIFFGQISEIFLPGNEKHAEEQAFVIMIKFFVLGGITWFLNFIGLYTWNITGSRQALRFKKVYYQTLLQQEVAWYDSNDVNKLATEVSSNMVAVETAIGEKVSILLTTTITTIFGFFYAYFKCWQLSLVLTGLLPFLMAAGILMMKAMTKKVAVAKVSFEGASGISEQAFAGIKTIKSMAGQEFENNKFVKALSESQKKVVKFILFSSVAFGVMNLIFLGLYSFGFFYGKQLIIWHPETYRAPVIIATFFCFLVGGASVGQIAPIMKNIAEGKVAAAQLYSLIERNKTLIEPQNGIQIQDIDVIKLKNIKFKYEKVPDVQQAAKETTTKTVPEHENQSEGSMDSLNAPNVIEDFSLNFQKGKVTAIVGESGCGKSTIIQLLMRYYDPSYGSIEINGIDLKEIDMKSYRSKIGIVGQEPVLFSMSIAENLRLANPDLKDAEIEEILRKANAWSFVSQTEDKIDTFVGTNGTQLSGGQKQRIAIARAMANNPSVLILDEATSALDRKNEKEIQKTLSNLSKGNITTVVIAHRLSTIRNADNIVVLNKGRIMEQGTHSQLFSQEGPYHQLVKSQMAAQINSNQLENYEQIQMSKEQKMNESEDETAEEILKNEEKKVEEEVPKEKLDAVFGKLLKQFKGGYGYLFVGCLAAIGNGLVWPFFNIAFSNIMALMANAPQNSSEINDYCLLFLAVAIGGSFLTFLFQFSLGISGERLVFNIRKKLFKKLLHLQVSYYDKPDNTPGGLSTKLSQDSQQIHNMITGVLGVMCLNLSTVAASLFLAFYYSWKLTLIVLGLAPLMAVTGAINMSVLKGMAEKSEKYEKATGSMISDTVCNIRTVKSFGNNKLFIKIFAERLDQVFTISSEKALKSSFLQGLSKGSIMFVEGLTFWIAAVLFANGHITDPKAIYISIFSIIFAAMGVGQNSQFMPDMGKAKHSGANIFEILESKDEIEKSEETEDIELKESKIKGKIEFKNVNFKYPSRDATVLNDFSLKIEVGEKIGFVGPSGSGKSTITQLLLRFYDIQSGKIQIDGRDIKSYPIQTLRRQLGIVSQEPTLFLGSVKQNIIYNEDISSEIADKKVQQAAQIAHAKNFIEEWNEKYEKDVGQKGSQVSGGQKQRIALARCLIRNPTIILLDESTSALDADTEAMVFESLKKVLKGKTSISIAHRLCTIEDSDRIIVMRDGKIIEEGKYNDLMEKKENFFRLAKGLN